MQAVLTRVKSFIQSAELISRWSILLFVLSVAYGIYCLFVGINNSLLEVHSFRQTQTALTSLFFLKDGFKLAYETPILGHPWTIPFEFPLYQWVVALFSKKTTIPLDPSGRIISMFFYIVFLVYLFKLIKRYIAGKNEIRFLFVFILLHPVYLYWSRTFMIESTVLALSLMYVYYSLQLLDDLKNYKSLAVACLTGVLAALVKVTTFLPFMMVLFFIVVLKYYQENKFTLKLSIIARYMVLGVLLFLIPVLLTKCWVDYCDKLRTAEFSQFLNSGIWDTWYYGTMEQKTSLNTWSQILERSGISHPVFYVLYITALALALIKKLKYSYHSLVCLGLYLLTPLIFTNLHYAHYYYTYSNSFFFSISIGFLILSFLNEKLFLMKAAGIVISLAVIAFFLYRYVNNYYSIQAHQYPQEQPIVDFVKSHTKPSDVVLIYGYDWGSDYAYYFERKSIALRDVFQSVNDPSFVKAMEQNKAYNINTLFFARMPSWPNYKDAFAQELIHHMGFRLVYQLDDLYFVYQR